MIGRVGTALRRARAQHRLRRRRPPARRATATADGDAVMAVTTRRAGPAGGRRRDRRRRRLRRRARRHALGARAVVRPVACVVRTGAWCVRFGRIALLSRVCALATGATMSIRHSDLEAQVESAAVSQPIPGERAGKAEGGCPRLPLQPRHRRRLDGARPTRSPRRSASSSRSPASASHAPAVLLVSFVPMLFIAAAYRYLNKADPDPRHDASPGSAARWARTSGWINGWAIVVADIIVMASARADRRQVHVPAVRLGLGRQLERARRSSLAVVWIALMTWICWRGHRAVRAHAARAALRRGRRSWRCSPSSRW